MMIDVLFVDKQVILPATALMPIVMAVMNLDTLPRTAPTRFLYQECHTTTADFILGMVTPTTRIDHTPIMVPHREDISTGHSPTPIPTMTEAAVLKGTPHAPLPATTAACATLQPMDAPITPCTVIPTDIVAPHPALTTSPTGTTHATPWTGASLFQATHTAQHKDLSPEKSSNALNSQHLINPTTPRLSPSRISLLILHQVVTVTLIV